MSELMSSIVSDDVRLTQMEDILDRADQAYHTEANPIMEDGEYDALKREYVALKLKLDGEEPVKIGAPVDPMAPTIWHGVPMLSLDNAFTLEDLQDFVSRVQKALGFKPGAQVHAVSEPKVDGLSLSLRYVDGKLATAGTRGDGAVGEDVTRNARVIQAIPDVLKGKAPEFIEIRGELYMPKSSLAIINLQREELGLKLFPNTRNAAAGSMRHSDPSVVAARGLRFMAYSLGECSEEGRFETQVQLLEKLTAWGFEVSEHIGYSKTAEEMAAHHGFLMSIRDSLDYEIDGVVHKLDSLLLRKRAGETDRVPRWAIAHKFPAEVATTRLLGITVQVGRSGVLTPVAELAPIFVGGVVVSRATLHNADHVGKLGLAVGDTVSVRRAGDVIPEIIGVLPDLRPDGSKVWAFPSACPSCGGVTQRLPNSAFTVCTNKMGCPDQAVTGIQHAVSREAFDIDGLGPEKVALLYERGFLNNIADIYALERHAPALALLPGWGQKTITALLANIEKRRSVPADRLLVALGIPEVGPVVARAIATRWPNPDIMLSKLMSVGQDDQAVRGELLSIAGIGPTMADKVANYFSDELNREVVVQLVMSITLLPLPSGSKDSRHAGKVVVFTGTLSRPRPVMAAEAEKAGLTSSNTITAATNYLVVGENAGSKVEKAQALIRKGASLRMFSEAEWAAFLKG